MTIPVSTLIQSKAKLQVKCLCVLIFLSFPLTMTEVPGPCRHSITREHLLTVRQLMDNQLRSGCSITYTFIEQRSLSKCCFVKAALPWILELLTTHFKYNRGSVNDGYVQSLRALILNIYSQKCVPQINEEVEDKPESFEMLYRGSPSDALQKVSEVLSVYWELVTTRDTPVDWKCQNEYTEIFSSATELSTESFTQYFTDSYDRNSAKASQRRPVKNLHKLGFIVTSICGGLLFILTLYCLITHKKTHNPHGSRIHTNSRDLQELEMEPQ
ncbi:macrophage colony-stimulating factor 1b isoform X2 [Acanthochromis polyacanthus]|uniref:Macrophage colony-stimulating factor 1-like n=1 Tax=Acanthochromis polyacanthus TaxID=80966 RepID=A0A3Q1ED35_9TELE|nr:macrophage colony-stimulating factor 1b isoform X2 [Acanthochromis polyacanthus]XP_022057615.1 macrophage colony-stimulating factor 1b isoform X2 [Acanthochromis polyacanthus]